MAIYGLNVCKKYQRHSTCYTLLCLHFAIIVHRLINFLSLNFMRTCTYMCVCVCCMYLMHLILINASFCFVHAVQESQTVQRLR